MSIIVIGCGAAISLLNTLGCVVTGTNQIVVYPNTTNSTLSFELEDYNYLDKYVPSYEYNEVSSDDRESSEFLATQRAPGTSPSGEDGKPWVLVSSRAF